MCPILCLGDKHFQGSICSFNNGLSFESLGCKVDSSVAGSSAVLNFRISGELYHRIGACLPTPGTEPSFAEIHIVGPGGEDEADICVKQTNASLNNSLMLELQNHFFWTTLTPKCSETLTQF